MGLREHTKQAPGVDIIKATVNELIECQHANKVLQAHAMHSSTSRDGTKAEKGMFFADLVVITDGYFLDFGNSVMGDFIHDSVSLLCQYLEWELNVDPVIIKEFEMEREMCQYLELGLNIDLLRCLYHLPIVTLDSLDLIVLGELGCLQMFKNI
ncbi:hypothetical protein PAXRUDRAFT_24880 [Paxillus rubicundulus Ve08.2h10]|uniref:Uncharacterized protein n=1 Tax=Paxillus rubicundulus Ve08.2h10 TaxID=930991 RepID=A0A0D0DT59_9AGAM|nr:hypothetical protein PAXRUDRAFT_24880 [Paxillus rubicundulus Ve08.2h10]